MIQLKVGVLVVRVTPQKPKSIKRGKYTPIVLLIKWNIKKVQNMFLYIDVDKIQSKSKANIVYANHILLKLPLT